MTMLIQPLNELDPNNAFALEFARMASVAHNMAKRKGWWEDHRSMAESLALVHSEVSEMLEVARQDPDQECEKCPDFYAIETEAADVVIRMMDLCEHFQINLAAAIVAKIEYNETRPHKHGKKF